MHSLQLLLVAEGLAPPFHRPEQQAAILSAVADMEAAPDSLAAADGVVYFVVRSRYDTHLALLYDRERRPPAAGDFAGTDETRQLGGVNVVLKLCERSHANAAAIRRHLPFTAPGLLGSGPSIGLGDRLGIATPAHVRAVRATGVRPAFAQQSIREMSRTGRSPDDVLDDATWGVLQEGYRDGYAADADHLKSVADLEACVAAGFTMFTVDPGDHVDDAAAAADADGLATRFAALPWAALETSPEACRATYLARTGPLADGHATEFSEETLARAAAKYGAAVAHAVALYRRLAELKGAEPFDFEVSVDETATPTSPLEHYYVAAELRRLGVRCTSLAPRFVGEFEKGIDYQGDLEALDRSLADHAAIARALGKYKLSIHSGSDKFSVYPLAADRTGGAVHVKTAGTSYVEALRAVAVVAPDLFRDILDFARERYAADRATYHVSGEVANVPDLAALPVDDLPHLLDQPDARQVLHVTYGSVLGAADADGSPRFRTRLLDTLRLHEDVHFHVLERHLRRHIDPLRKG